MCPRGLMGSASGRMIGCPSARAGQSARFSTTVRPVTVMQSPVMSPSCSRYFMTAGVPPIRCTSSITYCPLGLRSAM